MRIKFFLKDDEEGGCIETWSKCKSVPRIGDEVMILPMPTSFKVHLVNWVGPDLIEISLEKK